MPDLKKTLTVSDLAKMLGVSGDCIYTMVRKKEIPHIRIRSRIVFREDTIESWIAEQEDVNYHKSVERAKHESIR